MNYVFLACGWALYFVSHSVFAADLVKSWMHELLGNAFRFYRLIYSLFSTIGLVALLIFNGNIQSGTIIENEGLVRYLSLMFTTFGVMTMQLAFRQYKLRSFLGLAEENNELRIEGILKIVRHPIYSGLLLITIGFFLFIPTVASMVSCLSIFIYLPVGMRLEEKKLVAAFGEKYISYRQSVPALIPRIISRKEP